MTGYMVKYNQAVENGDPAVINEIADDDINLCVWHSALSQRTIDYLDNSQERLGRYLTDGNGSKRLITIGNDPVNYHSWRLASDHEKRERLKKYFAAYPAGENRNSLIEDVGTLIDIFHGAVDRRSRDFGLVSMVVGNIFRWHLDGAYEQGTITLTGNKGMLWRPQDSVPVEWLHDRRLIKEDVDPDAQKNIIQEIDTHDFAVFRGDKTSKPLVHATPPYSMSGGPRTVLAFFATG